MDDTFVMGVIAGLILSYASIFHVLSGVLIGIFVETRFEKGRMLFEYIQNARNVNEHIKNEINVEKQE